MIQLTLIRTEAQGDRTLGQLLINGEFFCHTLEDTLRHPKIKVAHHTAIQAGLYPFEVSYSPRFQRDMILIANVPNFVGVRIHGGNDEGDTSGCPLVAFNRNRTKIWGTAEKELLEKVMERGGKGWISVHNYFRRVAHE